MKMSCFKTCSVVAIVSMLCVTGLVRAEWTPRQTAAKQYGGTLFFVAHQGQLREILFNPVMFNQVLVNQGSAYNNDTGVFIASVPGIYQFVFAAQLCRGTHNNRWNFMVNGAEQMACHAQLSGAETTLNTCYFMAELQKGDKVWIKQQVGSCAWASTTSKTITFSGVLLASEIMSTLSGKHGSGISCPIPSLGKKIANSGCGGRSVTFSSLATALLLRCILLE